MQLCKKFCCREEKKKGKKDKKDKKGEEAKQKHKVKNIYAFSLTG